MGCQDKRNGTYSMQPNGQKQSQRVEVIGNTIGPRKEGIGTLKRWAQHGGSLCLSKQNTP